MKFQIPFTSAKIARTLVACSAMALLLVSNAQAQNERLQSTNIVPLSTGKRHDIERTLRGLGVLGSHTPYVRILTRQMKSDSAANATVATATVATATDATANPLATSHAPLTFVCKGFEESEAGPNANTKFQSFLNKTYAYLVATYGEPVPEQRGRAVAVKYEAGIGDGIYSFPAANSTSGGEILYEPVSPDTGSSQAVRDATDYYNLLRLCLRAFHGRRLFESDAWEQGFADAAALVTISKYYPSNFDPSAIGTYFLNSYDLFNRPNLGNKYFYSNIADTGLLLGYRAGMAQAAWLKVYVEDPNFFKKVNTSYNETLAGDDATLIGVASQIVPRVEGLPFVEWYKRQYILDTRKVPGRKLWFAAVPLSNTQFGGVAQWYETLSDGEERPLNGIGSVSAVDERRRDITAKSPNFLHDRRVIFPVDPQYPGTAELDSQNQPGNNLPILAFSGLGSATEPDKARITLQVRAGDRTAEAYFPYQVMQLGPGTNAEFASSYGATVGADTGTLGISVVANGRQWSRTTAKVERAVFQAGGTRYPSGPSVKTTFTLSVPGAPVRTFVRNSAWSAQGIQVAVLDTGLTTPADVTVPVKILSGLRMIAPPVSPLATDELAALKVPASALNKLARYRPSLDVTKIGDKELAFGIESPKHELYPRITEKFAPGRGYWIDLKTDVNAAVTGIVPPTTTPYEVPLRGGWNQIGVPFNLRFALGAVRVSYNDGAPMTWPQAVEAGLVSPGVWRWKNGGGYGRVDGGAVSSQFIQAFEGVYLFTPKAGGVKLIFDTRQGIATTPTAPPSAANWQLSLMAVSGTQRDSDNAFGVTSAVGAIPARRAGAKPPPAIRALTVRFITSGNNVVDASGAGNESGWAESLTLPVTSLTRWAFNVEGAQPGQSVQLVWGDPTKLPVALDFTLRDVTANKEIALTGPNRVTTYAYIAGSGARRFFIQAKKPATQVGTPEPSPLSLAADPLTGSGKAIITARAGDAKVLPYRVLSLQIQTPDGQTVRTLFADRMVSLAVARWQWDGRDDNGDTLPSGRYVARLRWSQGSTSGDAGDAGAGETELSAEFDLR